MIYKLMAKKSTEIKNIIDAKTKQHAILYFSTLLNLSQEDLLKIFIVK